MVNNNEIKQKLLEKLEKSGWKSVLKPFIDGSEFDKILDTLREDVNTGQRFTPTLSEMFRAFEECPYDKLKMVWIGMDPYFTINAADGIAFSCSKGKMQPSLRHIYKEIDRKIYNGTDTILKDGDLKRWSNQGVLLLNTALTARIGKAGVYIDLWKPFTSFVLDVLNLRFKSLIFVFLGKKAEYWEDFVNDHHYKFIVSHPASAAYTGSVWETVDTFPEITHLIKEHHNYSMLW